MLWTWISRALKTIFNFLLIDTAPEDGKLKSEMMIKVGQIDWNWRIKSHQNRMSWLMKKYQIEKECFCSKVNIFRTTGGTTWTWRKTPGEGALNQFDRFELPCCVQSFILLNSGFWGCLKQSPAEGQGIILARLPLKVLTVNVTLFCLSGRKNESGDQILSKIFLF